MNNHSKINYHLNMEVQTFFRMDKVMKRKNSIDICMEKKISLINFAQKN